MNYELDVGVLMWLVSRASRIFPRMRMHPVFGSVEDGFELCRMYKPFILATSISPAIEMGQPVLYNDGLPGSAVD